MTTLSAPARPEQHPRLAPLPWRRMGWVIWRQHRIVVAGVAALLGALAAYLWIVGRELHHAYTAATACHPLHSAACVNAVSGFNSLHRYLLGGYVFQPLPALIGAFVGAPVLARELETGTFRYAWTQGFGRSRWTIAKLVALALTVIAGAAAMSLLFSWYYRPYFGAGNQALTLRAWSPLDAYLFDLRGIAFPAWTLLAFAIGVLAGVLIRQVVPAIAVTLAAYTGLAVAAATFLRQHYLSPLTTSRLNPPASALLVSQWWTKAGNITTGPWNNPHICPPSAAGKSRASYDALLQCFARHGYTLWHGYQPGSWFWTFQWIEASWLLMLSALLLASTVWIVQRRAA
jgi:hypothetical protein